MGPMTNDQKMVVATRGGDPADPLERIAWALLRIDEAIRNLTDVVSELAPDPLSRR